MCHIFLKDSIKSWKYIKKYKNIGERIDFVESI